MHQLSQLETNDCYFSEKKYVFIMYKQVLYIRVATIVISMYSITKITVSFRNMDGL